MNDRMPSDGKTLRPSERRFEYRKGTSSKFWSIRLRAKEVIINFGRIGTKGKDLSKSFADHDKAEAFAAARIKEKLSKGYREVGASPASGKAAESDASVISNECDWFKEHGRLWRKLVPASGQAKTLQGEIIRITGKLTDEAYRNGNCNWDQDCVFMWRFVARVLDDPRTFSPAERTRTKKTVEEIIRNERCPDLSGRGSTYYYMMEMATRWCVANPKWQPHRQNSSLNR